MQSSVNNITQNQNTMKQKTMTINEHIVLGDKLKAFELELSLLMRKFHGARLPKKHKAFGRLWKLKSAMSNLRWEMDSLVCNEFPELPNWITQIYVGPLGSCNETRERFNIALARKGEE